MIHSKKEEYVIKIGSKGEIFPPKELRERLGLEKGNTVILNIENNTLIVRKLYSSEEILSRGAKVKISHHAMKELRKELSEGLENRG